MFERLTWGIFKANEGQSEVTRDIVRRKLANNNGNNTKRNYPFVHSHRQDKDSYIVLPSLWG